MHKRKIHHLLVVLRPISYWYFVAIFLVSAFVAAYALRQNNLEALRLRDHVIEVDKQNGDVEKALRELREFTYSHMNANLASDNGIYPPIQLKYRYERLIAADLKRLEGNDRDVYAEAQRHCEAQNPTGFLGATRLGCIQQYVDQNARPEARPKPIPDDLYKFDFASPRWSPDLAGWSIVIAVFALVLLIIRLAAQLWLKRLLTN